MDFSWPETKPRVTETQLLDRYLLPKIALTVIIIASFIGTWLTMTTHEAGAWQQVLPRWLHLVAFGLLAGGYMWKALFVQPAGQEEQSAELPVLRPASSADSGGWRA